MKKLFATAALLLVVTTTGACKMQNQYECTIKDAKTGEVIKKFKVPYKEQCQLGLL